MSAAPPDIFISYAREDEAWVRPLAIELMAAGRTVFWDRRIPAGQTWRSHIGRAVKAARCVVVVWSEHSVDSEWVLEEAEQGKKRRVLVPVLKQPVEPPIGFSQIQGADLSGWRRGEPSEEFAVFLDDLGNLLASSVESPVAEPEPHVYQSPPPTAKLEPSISVTRESLGGDLKLVERDHKKGSIRFDYSTSDGKIVLGNGDQEFQLRFSKAGDKSTYLYKDGTNLKKITRIKSAPAGAIIQFSDYDSSSSLYMVSVGKHFMAENSKGFYLQGRIIEIQDDMRGAEHDEVRFDYEIGDIGQTRFGAL